MKRITQNEIERIFIVQSNFVDLNGIKRTNEDEKN